MRSATYAKMLRLEENGPSYAALSSLLFEAYGCSLDRQQAVETALDPIIAALASGEMDPATAAQSLTDAKSQLHRNILEMMLVFFVAIKDGFPAARAAEAAKMGVGKRSKKAGKLTPIRAAHHA